MGRKKDYKTKRNSISNLVSYKFKSPEYKKYNADIIKKFFVSDDLLTKWEKKFYTSIREQEFNITDNQYKTIYSIYLKYKN